MRSIGCHGFRGGLRQALAGDERLVVAVNAGYRGLKRRVAPAYQPSCCPVGRNHQTDDRSVLREGAPSVGPALRRAYVPEVDVTRFDGSGRGDHLVANSSKLARGDVDSGLFEVCAG